MGAGSVEPSKSRKISATAASTSKRERSATNWMNWGIDPQPHFTLVGGTRTGEGLGGGDEEDCGGRN